MREKFHKLMCLMLCLIVCVASTPSLPAPKVSAASTLEELQSERKGLQEDLDKINKKLSDIKDEKEKAREKINTYQERKRIVEQQIATLLDIIRIRTDELTDKQQELDDKLRQCRETTEKFKKRIRAMYMNNTASDIAALMSLETYSEFVQGAELLRRVSEQDNKLIRKLDKERQEIVAAQLIVEQNLDALFADRLELDNKYNELAALLREANEQLSAAEAMQEVTEEERDRILEEFEKNKREIDQLMGTGEGDSLGSGLYGWPVPGFSYISSGFGWRTLYGLPNYHTGIDIAGAGIYGARVVASDDGRIAHVAYGSTGYGYYILVDHGSNNWTLYGHLSSIGVKVGDYVVKGETIGNVGSTGNSTGPHLHFEIRLNGQQINPINYVSYT